MSHRWEQPLIFERTFEGGQAPPPKGRDHQRMLIAPTFVVFEYEENTGHRGGEDNWRTVVEVVPNAVPEGSRHVANAYRVTATFDEIANAVDAKTLDGGTAASMKSYE